MGGGTADVRPTGVVSFLETIHDHQRHEMASLPIPDELLAEILLRLPTPADLVRTSAACVPFRRVAAHRSFLRRYRKLHAPPFLGFLGKHKYFLPAEPPHPSAPAASAVNLAADFSFSFLPEPGSDWLLEPGSDWLPQPASDWVVRDIRDGRVVLDKSNWLVPAVPPAVFPEVVVCDPLHRRYLLLPPITASVEDPLWVERMNCTDDYTDIFLVPPGCCEEEAATADETSFRVIWMGQCKTNLVVFAFSSSTGQWEVVPSSCLIDLSVGLPLRSLFYFSRHYVYGCFYWLIPDWEEKKLLVLYTKTMEFSIAEFPLEANSCLGFTMVEAGEGRPGMFVLVDSRSYLSYFIRQDDCGSSSQWQKVKTTSLPSCAHLIGNMDKYLLLHLGLEDKSSLLEPGCYMMDIDSFQLEKVCALRLMYYKLHAYRNFPPSLLSSPTISSGVEEGPEKEVLEQGCAASSSTESPWSPWSG